MDYRQDEITSTDEQNMQVFYFFIDHKQTVTKNQSFLNNCLLAVSFGETSSLAHANWSLTFSYPAILYYDWVITFSEEVARIWKRRVTASSVLYIINLYSSLFGYMVYIVSLLDSHQVCLLISGRLCRISSDWFTLQLRGQLISEMTWNILNRSLHKMQEINTNSKLHRYFNAGRHRK